MGRARGGNVRFSVIRLLGRVGSDPRNLFGNFSGLRLRSIRRTLLCLSGVNTLGLRNNFLILCGTVRVGEVGSDGSECGRRSCQVLGRFCGRGVRRIRVINRCTGLVIEGCGTTLRCIRSCFRVSCGGFVTGCFGKREAGRVRRGLAPRGCGRLFNRLSGYRVKVVSSGGSGCVIITTNPNDKGAHMLMRGLTSLLLLRSMGRRRLLVLAFSQSTTARFGRELVRLVNGTTRFIRVGAFRSCYFSLLKQVNGLRSTGSIMGGTTRVVGRKRIRPGGVKGAILIVSRTRSVNARRCVLMGTLVARGRRVHVVTINSSSRGVCRFHNSSSKCVCQLTRRPRDEFVRVPRGCEDTQGLMGFAGRFTGKVYGEAGDTPVVSVGRRGK